jgi:small subunit ribosomal protein S20
VANIKSQKKRILTNEKRRLRNLATRSELKTRVKNARTALAEGSEAAPTLIQTAQKRLSMAAYKGRIHKNAAARRTSRLMKAANRSKAAN